MAKRTAPRSTNAAAKKTTAKTRSSTAGKKPAVKKAAPKKQEFTDEQIAMKAYEIYQARMARGEKGHSDDDWHMAVKELRKGKK
ncbi:MAG: hypothetical protein AMS23_01030 [Bacteroides sp. SM1_62]|jgi:hypothetical protein|nr:MAG: hypothetical protein AMS26_04760 [Bacteroides sp. SM23_62]KPL26632.1 MAG: hypothetical protein AMS23_01030 [Bacteroides sp. SM1_62]